MCNGFMESEGTLMEMTLLIPLILRRYVNTQVEWQWLLGIRGVFAYIVVPNKDVGNVLMS